jgi:hypothetical protein
LIHCPFFCGIQAALAEMETELSTLNHDEEEILTELGKFADIAGSDSSDDEDSVRVGLL